MARSFDLREIGLLYYVMASSDRLADALRNAERNSRINNEGVPLRCHSACNIDPLSRGIGVQN